MLDGLSEVLRLALKDGLYVPDDLHFHDTKVAWRLTRGAHVREAQRLTVYSSLDSYHELQRVMGMHINAPLNSTQLTREALGDWLLTRTMDVGGERAVDDLRRLLETDCLIVEEHLAISGLEVTEPIQLPGGISLIPINEVPESELSISLMDPKWSQFARGTDGRVTRKSYQVLAGFGFSRWNTDPHVATSVLRLEHSRTPALVPSPVQWSPPPEPMVDIARVISAATCAAVFPVAHWVAPRPGTPFWDSFGWSGWFHQSAFRESRRAEAHVATIVAALENWKALDLPARKRLFIPLERLNLALAATNALDTAIDLGVSLEALLLGPEEHDQISLAFRLRGAWLLGDDANERRALCECFKAIYTCRSKVAHTGSLPSKSLSIDGTKVPPAEFIEKRARQLAARAILNVIKRGRVPDWNELLVGGEG